jgi:hypothetical protein
LFNAVHGVSPQNGDYSPHRTGTIVPTERGFSSPQNGDFHWIGWCGLGNTTIEGKRPERKDHDCSSSRVVGLPNG